MQLSKQFSGKVSGVALASLVVTGVTSATTLSGCVSISQALHAATKPGTKFYAPAQFMDPQGPWPTGVPSGTFELLWPRMVYQRTEASCSVASVTVAVNALRAGRNLPPVTQEAVVATDTSGRWWNSTQDGGAGLDLDGVHLATLRAAASLGDVPRDGHIGVQAVHMPAANAPSSTLVEAERALAFVLGRMAQAPAQTFVLVNFHQASLLRAGAPEGHLSVVGAWDETRQRVLILDVDDDHFKPYWVPLKALVAAMQLPDDVTGEPRGYLVLHRDR